MQAKNVDITKKTNKCENTLVKKAVAILRLKCKEMPKKKHLLVYVEGWTVQSLPQQQKLQKSLEIPNFQFTSKLKIQVD